MNKFSVIDFFCGAGGFSEGFRQQGFKIKMGIDNWAPAINTFNHNFGLKCKPTNILDFETSVEEIESLPDTEIIIGSPPCVTFSTSNTFAKANKASAKNLTRVFLRVVAVKKWKQDSKLKAWFMENVPGSVHHLNKKYSFSKLGLKYWAISNGIDPLETAIELGCNRVLINAADYGAAQCRKRIISGEIIKKSRIVVPLPSHTSNNGPMGVKANSWRTLNEVKKKLPSPYDLKSSKKVTDPNYQDLHLKLYQLTDHFYDAGVFECEWRQSRYAKTNHPYMGKMAFPENIAKPSRTVTATRIRTSRETLIYESEHQREGHGQYRTPTVRELACLMGFPISYQFIGAESTKWRLVGNAVCPSVSAAFAKQIRFEYNLKEIKRPLLLLKPNLTNVNDLNTFSLREFDIPPKRIEGSRFRRHPFKDGNITVTLSNYDVSKNDKNVSSWRTSIQYGNGEGFPTFNISDNYYKSLEDTINSESKGPEFLQIINNGFTEKIATKDVLQQMYEIKRSKQGFLEPTLLVENISEIIDRLKVNDDLFEQRELIVFQNKKAIPLKQLFALYAINKITSIANR